MAKTRIALAGIGKIARDQHIPTLANSDGFELAAIVTSHAQVDGVPAFRTVTEMMQALPDIQALSVCTPPRGRQALLEEAFAHGLDVMIEKPPAATVSEATGFADMAAKANKLLYVTWHSREGAAVEPARAWLKDKGIRRVDIAWKEDVRVWHPGQEWIWEPGIGVFDPGINALSVLTAIMPRPVRLEDAELRFPSNKDAPIAASLTMSEPQGAVIRAEFDFDQRGPQTWDIVVQTDAGTATLSIGGTRLAIDGEPVEVKEEPEYARLYRHFAGLLAARRSDTDLSPFHLVADAFLLGRRQTLGAFDWNG
ncbi:Gfo/Idh/MocA family oxidoreductase [uncultured Sphingomonas sp.]|uniref:Gfo/Idh/MocA family protein n=1 Tax=uncultured Sphingomonas sp. TaxID=158754 RepID=UPI0025E43211|nr:Gfo/Idh/MocA family oxidoreductase [uncultured Sphingomonas sp.]